MRRLFERVLSSFGKSSQDMGEDVPFEDFLVSFDEGDNKPKSDKFNPENLSPEDLKGYLDAIKSSWWVALGGDPKKAEEVMR